MANDRLVIFAGVQVMVQVRQESRRRQERQEDRNEFADRAFHYAWAEHFRLEGLAERLQHDDLIETALLGVLKPSDVRPHDWGELTRALASLGREAGYLGGVAAALFYDVEKAMAIFVASVTAFADEAPADLGAAERVEWIRTNRGQYLKPWEDSIRHLVQELSHLVWDASVQTERATVHRELDFSDNITSEFAEAALKSLKQRAAGELNLPAPLRPQGPEQLGQ